jgi:hypothetical protein
MCRVLLIESARPLSRSRCTTPRVALYRFDVRARRAVVNLWKTAQVRDRPHVLHRSTAMRANGRNRFGPRHFREVGGDADNGQFGDCTYRHGAGTIDAIPHCPNVRPFPSPQPPRAWPDSLGRSRAAAPLFFALRRPQTAAIQGVDALGLVHTCRHAGTAGTLGRLLLGS